MQNAPRITYNDRNRGARVSLPYPESIAEPNTKRALEKFMDVQARGSAALKARDQANAALRDVTNASRAALTDAFVNATDEELASMPESEGVAEARVARDAAQARLDVAGDATSIAYADLRATFEANLPAMASEAQTTVQATVNKLLGVSVTIERLYAEVENAMGVLEARAQYAATGDVAPVLPGSKPLAHLGVAYENLSAAILAMRERADRLTVATVEGVLREPEQVPVTPKAKKRGKGKDSPSMFSDLAEL